MNLFKVIMPVLVALAMASFAPPPATAGQDILSTTTKEVSSAATDQSSDWLRMSGNHASLVIEGAGTATVTLQDAVLAADDTTISISCGDRYQSNDNAFGVYGNLNADPLFRNLGGLTRDDYMLLTGSPAIGAATDGGNLGAMGVYTAPGGGGSGTTVGRIRKVAPAQVAPTRVQPRAVTPVQ